MRHMLHGPRLSPLAPSLVLADGHGAPPNDRPQFARGEMQSGAAMRQRVAAYRQVVTGFAASALAMGGEAAA
ncbi:MAG: hypothetical protein ABI939_11385 [Anaerolineaceae bacterium]